MAACMLGLKGLLIAQMWPSFQAQESMLHGWPSSLSRAGPIPAILRPPPAMMQPPLDLKPFLSFPVEAQPAVGLFPGFNTVQLLLLWESMHTVALCVGAADIEHSFWTNY
ncbi:hypothetical protein E2320_016258 [Naja naja]|nr:hypothetical protein E2320_016258 [Naja naja]